MKPKPGHLGLKYAEQFKDTSIVEVYHHRPPYSDEVINKLVWGLPQKLNALQPASTIPNTAASVNFILIRKSLR